MLILGLDAALARCSAVVWDDAAVRAEACEEGGRSYATVLPAMAQQVLRAAGLGAASLDGVAVTVGPGSFTGLRAALALAHGIGLAAGCPVLGVLVAEALAEALTGPAGEPGGGGRALWVAIDSRRGRVFLHRGEAAAESTALDALPHPAGPVAVAGDAGAAVAARLAARGADAVAANARLPLARHVAAVGARRLAGLLAPLPAQPLYVDPPEVRLPAGGLRAPPDAA
jgi:tRNA threonylcarbamoyladenosine biosynthesis protein TsaB